MTTVADPRSALVLELYEQMAVIRQTEKAAYDLFMSGLVKGTTHLASGHEAVAVGAFVYCAALGVLWLLAGRPRAAETTAYELILKICRVRR